MLIVVGGQSRNLGKTSVVAGLIAALPERRWIAVKITQYGHGVCSRDGQPCECATADHSWAITEERDASGSADTCRFLAAGARQALWVRTRQGHLAEAMPSLRSRLHGAVDVIIESNSILKFVRPDLYLTVLDSATEDFKLSARQFLDRADAVLLHESASGTRMSSSALPRKLLAGKPQFLVRPPEYIPPGLVDFVRTRLGDSREKLRIEES